MTIYATINLDVVNSYARNFRHGWFSLLTEGDKGYSTYQQQHNRSQQECR